jgi:hypothetical protein
VAIGIAKINRVCDFVILEFEFDSAFLQLALSTYEVFPVRAKRQMKHSNLAMRGRFQLLVRWEQGDPGISFANESRHTIPHAIVKPLEPENVDVPFGRSFDVAHAHGYVINTFELHEMLDRMYRIYRIAETIKVERVVLNGLASAVGRVPLLIHRRCVRRELRLRQFFRIVFREVDPPWYLELRANLVGAA